MAETVGLEDRLRIVGAGFVYRFRDTEEVEFLIIKRTKDTGIFPALWTVPSGGLEQDDYIDLPEVNGGWEDIMEEVTRREIYEEAGVKVGEMQYVSNFVFIRPNDRIPVLGIRFIAPYVSGDVLLDPKDATDWAWVTAEEAERYQFLGNILTQIQKLAACVEASSR